MQIQKLTTWVQDIYRKRDTMTVTNDSNKLMWNKSGILLLIKNCQLCTAIGQLSWSSSWVKLIPSLNPCDHSICQLVKVRIHLTELLLNLFGQFNIALLNSGAVFWKNSRLEEWDNLFLPEYAFVFFLKVHKRVTCFTVPDVWQTCLHSQSQMVTYHLKQQSLILDLLVLI